MHLLYESKSIVSVLSHKRTTVWVGIQSMLLLYLLKSKDLETHRARETERDTEGHRDIEIQTKRERQRGEIVHLLMSLNLLSLFYLTKGQQWVRPSLSMPWYLYQMVAQNMVRSQME